MKYIVLVLLATMLFSCGTKSRTQESIKWINAAKKPIVVYARYVNGITINYAYTLVDSSGIMYYTGEVSLLLPDTIR